MSSGEPSGRRELSDKAGELHLLHGHSMLPNLRPGDRMWVVRSPLESVRFWDLVFFRGKDGQGVLHRAWGRTAGKEGVRLRTKGDFCWAWDDPVKAEDFLGVGVALFRDSRRRIVEGGWARLSQGAGALIFLPLGKGAEALRRAAAGMILLAASLAHRLARGRRGAFPRVVRRCAESVWSRCGQIEGRERLDGPVWEGAEKNG